MNILMMSLERNMGVPVSVSEILKASLLSLLYINHTFEVMLVWFRGSGHRSIKIPWIRLKEYRGSLQGCFIANSIGRKLNIINDVRVRVWHSTLQGTVLTLKPTHSIFRKQIKHDNVYSAYVMWSVVSDVLNFLYSYFFFKALSVSLNVMRYILSL